MTATERAAQACTVCGKAAFVIVLLLFASLIAGLSAPAFGAAAQDPQLPEAPGPQNNAPPPARPEVKAPEAPAPPANPGESAPPAAETNAPNPSSAPAGPPPANPITTVAPGAATNIPGSPRDQLFTLTKSVNFVLVPVTVKNADGQLVQGLLPDNFSVYEDAIKQKITFFTSDPFPLSAVVVLDVGLPEITWKKVQDTLPALVGAFSQFDEVSVFTYRHTVRKLQDFTGVNAQLLSASLRTLKHDTGENGTPVVGGPLTGIGPNPTINGQPVQPNVPLILTYDKESYVLNDAILAAATELGKRDPTRRKVLLVVSDGREFGSAAKYNEVMKVLLSHEIALYAVDVNGGIPGYRTLEKVRVPGLGYGDILPKYASATGGQVFAELNNQAIETAYARVTEEARNQYTIGYTTALRPSDAYRSIEVRVNRPNLRIYAKDGYYPLPPQK